MGGNEDQGQGFHRLQLYIPHEETLVGIISRFFKGNFMFLDYWLCVLDHHLYHRDRADAALRSDEG
jgi:hypothetical protein